MHLSKVSTITSINTQKWLDRKANLRLYGFVSFYKKIPHNTCELTFSSVTHIGHVIWCPFVYFIFSNKQNIRKQVHFGDWTISYILCFIKILRLALPISTISFQLFLTVELNCFLSPLWYRNGKVLSSRWVC